MSVDSPSLLGALQSGAGAVPRRPGARRLLEDCWTPIRNAVELRFADILLETLGPLAKSEDEDEARPAKHVLLRDKATLQAFSESLQAEFKQAIDDFCAQRIRGKPTGAPGLTLVEYDDMEFATLMERASARIRNAADDEFGSLKIRLANLVREPEVRDIENPFRPVIFLRAMYLALERIGIDEPDLLRMTKRFDSALVEPIAAAYSAVDRHLAAQGIAADVAPITITRNSLTGVPATPFTNSVLGAYQNTRNTIAPISIAGIIGPPTTTGPQFTTGLAVDQVLQALYQRMSLVGGPVMPGAGVPALPESVLTAHAPMQAVASTAAGRLAGSSWGTAPASVGAQVAMVDPALLAAIGEAQRIGAVEVAPAQAAAVEPAVLRTQITEKASRQVDKLTIEIVGMLFERIHQDKHVPAPIKEQLVRLQFPLIRVALTDPELFVSPKQPARELLDRIAATSIGWVQEGEQNERYLAEVRQAIATVLASTDEGLAPFQHALDAFEIYLTQENTRDDDPVARAKRAIEEAETREVQAINATIQIRQAFEGVMLESYLRDFLLETWVRVLVAANQREAVQPGLMRHYLKLVPALVWTVQPKVNPEEKQHLARKVAPVLTALREGLALIEWPQSKSQEFFARLMNSHAQAVKALELAQGATAAFNPSTMRIKLDGVTMSAEAPAGDNAVSELPVSDDEVTRVLAANHVAVKHVSAPPEAPPPSADAELDRHIESLRRGDWFDLTSGDRVERVQLRWLSPRRAIYLFATAQDERIFSMKPATLRSLMREGRVAPVEAEHIFDRALRETMDVLQSAVGEAATAA
jgi:streptomycin 6-kinase